MKNYYLEQIGIDINKCYWNAMEDDDKQSHWKEQQEKYGFDSRETWSLDFTFVHWFYPRLKMYLDIGGKYVDLEFHKFEFKGKTYTQKECIEKIILGFDMYLKSEYDAKNLINDAFELSGIIMRSLWW